jgi:hypothetical protein
MDETNTAILYEAYQRLHSNGPEYGGDDRGDNGLTNHGPMAAEVMCRRDLGLDVHRWLDRYTKRLAELPGRTEPITGTNWQQALGGGRERVGDWTAYFTRQFAERPWREVLTDWWPRLLPGIAAGSTHGVIRVSHAARVILNAEASGPALDELGHGLGFWAARYRAVPGGVDPAGQLPAADAMAGIPRLPEQSGRIAQRLGQLAHVPGWPAALRALRSPGTADEVPGALAELIDIATVRYLDYAPASPVLLVHTATAPNAVLRTLPALPRTLWLPSFCAAWSATAAITATYAPASPPQLARMPVPGGTDPAGEVLERAARHGDEHVIKLTDTAVEVYARTADPDALAAALRAAELIEQP